MGSDQSRAMPRIEGFGARGGVDRSKRHDFPWIQTLKEIALFEVDDKALDEFLLNATDVELHCCRAFFRAHLKYQAIEGLDDEDEKSFCRGLYFLLAQQPSQLVAFYSILHHCWSHHITTLGPYPSSPPLLGTNFVETALAVYTEEKGPTPENNINNDNNQMVARSDDDLLLNNMRSLVFSYLSSMTELAIDPSLQDPSPQPCDATGRSLWFPLCSPDSTLEVRVAQRGATLCSVRPDVADDGSLLELVPGGTETTLESATLLRGPLLGSVLGPLFEGFFSPSKTEQHDDDDDDDMMLHSLEWVPAREPSNASGSMQTFYCRMGGDGQKKNVLFRAQWEAQNGRRLKFHLQVMNEHLDDVNIRPACSFRYVLGSEGGEDHVQWVKPVSRGGGRELQSVAHISNAESGVQINVMSNETTLHYPEAGPTQGMAIGPENKIVLKRGETWVMSVVFEYSRMESAQK